MPRPPAKVGPRTDPRGPYVGAGGGVVGPQSIIPLQAVLSGEANVSAADLTTEITLQAELSGEANIISAALILGLSAELTGEANVRVARLTAPGIARQLVEWPDREIVVIAELEPSIVVDGFGAVAATTNVYSLPFAAVEADSGDVPGGVYRPVIGVREDDTDLVEAVDVADCDATAGSWYWDEAAEVLYVHATASGSPDDATVVQAFVRLHMATTGKMLGDIYHHPWITGQTQAAIDQLPASELFGLKATPKATLQLTNGHGFWHRVLAPNSSWTWKNKRVRLKLGGSFRGIELLPGEYDPITTMEVEDVGADEETGRLVLKPLTRSLDLTLPRTPVFSDTYPNLDEGVEGKRKPIGYGRATTRPLLVDTTASEGLYLVADPAFQDLDTVHEVWAVGKETGTRTSLTVTTDYTVDLAGCTITVVNATYSHDTHYLEVDATGIPITTFAGIVEDLLKRFLGYTDADLDTASFTQAAADAPDELAVWLTSPRTIGSILQTGQADQPSLERSVLGLVRQTREGLWQVRIRGANVDPTQAVHLQQQDIASFHPEPTLESAFATTKIFYGRNLSTGAWSSEEATDEEVQHRLETEDHVELYTFLRNAADAEVMATRFQLIAGGVRTAIEFEERAAKLYRAAAGDPVVITYSPALDAGGAFEAETFELMELEKLFSPVLQTSGMLRDTRGLRSTRWIWAGDDAPADYSSASLAQRQIFGFWADDAGEIVPGDPTTRDIKEWA